MRAAAAQKSGLVRSNLATATGSSPAALKAVARALQTIGTKAVVHVHRHFAVRRWRPGRHGALGLTLVGGAH